MPRFFLLFAALVAPAFTAPWDGARGPFSVATFTSPASLPGIPGTGITATVIYIQCADPTVSGVRVAITYRNGGREVRTVLISGFTENGYGGVVTTIPQDDIVAVRFIELREGASH